MILESRPLSLGDQEEGGRVGDSTIEGSTRWASPLGIMGALPGIVWREWLPAMLRSRRIGAMRDIELYLLGLTAPWRVAGVDVDMTWQRWWCGRTRGRRVPV